MDFLDKIFKRQATPSKDIQRQASQIAALMVDDYIANQGVSRAVHPETALTIGAVWAAVRVLSETVASLPLHMYQRVENGRERAINHPLYSVLHDAPNPYQSSFEFQEFIMASMQLWGNAYCQIESNGRGDVIALWPLLPGHMGEIVLKDGRKWFHYNDPEVEIGWIDGQFIWHVRGLSMDGLRGISPISAHRRMLGISLASEEYGSRFFDNDARPGGILEHPGVLGDEAYERLSDTWESRHQGLDKAHRIAILEEGMSYNEIGMSNVDSQFLESRKFQVNEIARIFRIPPHMIGDLENATYSNIEHQGIDFVTHSIRPWLVRLEQAIASQLLFDFERADFYPAYLVDSLLRGDILSRYQAYAVARTNGWMNANEIREKEDMNPIEGEAGDGYLAPLNLASDKEREEIFDIGEGSDQEEEEDRQVLAKVEDIEIRQASAVLERVRLNESYQLLFRDALTRLLKRETKDIKAAAGRYLKRGDVAGFIAWLKDFYERHGIFITEVMNPIYQTFATAVVRTVQQEVNKDQPVATQAFVEQYTVDYAERYTDSQFEIIEGIVMQDEEPGVLLAAVDSRMDQWLEAKPEQETQAELSRSNNAFAFVAYGALAILIKTWRSVGGDCVYCSQVSGRSVNLRAPFIRGGEVLPGGKKGAMTIYHNINHPPLHRGCNCVAVSGD